MSENNSWQAFKADLKELLSNSNPLIRFCATALIYFGLICLYDAYFPAFMLAVKQSGPLVFVVHCIGLVTSAQLIYKLLRTIGKTIIVANRHAKPSREDVIEEIM